ncbi:MAG TPA: CRISPR system precrRNA processing endoribonuclease RAMP protein Cas6 [Saprospiraceae bacterium]|nr:CRISPR system precrRNA processing endoribonuclease RAMP protein Cas6 [Saprospiraceae bacterium]
MAKQQKIHYSPIESLTIYPLTFCFQAESYAEMPVFPIPLIRAAIGKTLQKLEQKDAIPILDGAPVSAYLFNNQMADNHPWHKEYQEPPRGFWLSSVAGNNNLFQPGDIFQIKCTFSGMYSRFTEVLVKVLKEAGVHGFGIKNAAFSLISVNSESAYGRQSIVWKATNPIEINEITGVSIHDYHTCSLTGNELKIHFKTATALSKSHSIFGGIPFMELTELLAKRLTLLSNMYCASPFSWDKTYDRSEIRDIYVAESDLKWKIYSRISNRQHATAPVEGYEGNVIYITGKSNQLRQFLPILLFGQHTHIGRNITFGGGQYEIDHGSYRII